MSGIDMDLIEDELNKDDLVTPSKTSQEGEDPLELLKTQVESLRASNEAAERRAAELEARTREHEKKLEASAATELAQHKAVIEQAYQNEEMKLRQAQARYTACLAGGDLDGVGSAQLEMVQANSRMERFSEAYGELERKEKEPPRKQEPSQDEQFEAALRQMHPNVAQWVRTHKDDVLKPDRQRIAYAADQMAVARGYIPGSEAYMAFMDDQMGYSEVAASAESAARPAARRPLHRIAAPPSRMSSSSGSKQPAITENERKLAQSFGLTDEEWVRGKQAADQAARQNPNSKIFSI